METKRGIAKKRFLKITSIKYLGLKLSSKAIPNGSYMLQGKVSENLVGLIMTRVFCNFTMQHYIKTNLLSAQKLHLYTCLPVILS